MPKVNPKKTKLAHNWNKERFFQALAIGLVGSYFLLGIIFYAPVAQPELPKNYVTFGGKRIYVELAKTASQQTKGLGGRQSLAPGNGMLFVFQKPEIQCFWMKDMNFAIDIVWINTNNIVSQIDPSVLPQTYPNSFCSKQPVKYVLEIPADTSAGYKIYAGSHMTKNF